MRRHLETVAVLALAAVGIALVWLIRAKGWLCVDGVIVETQKPYGYCVDWNTATGGLWATIAIVALVAAWFVLRRMSGPGAVRIARVVIPALIAIVTVVGIVVNLALPDYPEGYPG